MFLNLLNEKEGKNFLELASIAMTINGVIKEGELSVFEVYKMELKLPNYEIKNKTFETVIKEFQSSTKKVKRAIIIELAAVLDADQEIDDNEHAWIEKIGTVWGFRDSEIKKMVRWTEDFNDLLEEGYSYINKR